MTRVVIRFAKFDLQSVVQLAAEFHDRNLPGIEHVLFLPVSGASFLYQKNGARNPIHTGKFSGARNVRQKLASLNAAYGALAKLIQAPMLPTSDIGSPNQPNSSANI